MSNVIKEKTLRVQPVLSQRSFSSVITTLVGEQQLESRSPCSYTQTQAQTHTHTHTKQLCLFHTSPVKNQDRIEEEILILTLTLAKYKEEKPNNQNLGTG